MGIEALFPKFCAFYYALLHISFNLNVSYLELTEIKFSFISGVG
jgi:hypothetical protein